MQATFLVVFAVFKFVLCPPNVGKKGLFCLKTLKNSYEISPEEILDEA
jgi:hypothetical protein